MCATSCALACPHQIWCWYALLAFAFVQQFCLATKKMHQAIFSLEALSQDESKKVYLTPYNMFYPCMKGPTGAKSRTQQHVQALVVHTLQCTHSTAPGLQSLKRGCYKSSGRHKPATCIPLPKPLETVGCLTPCPPQTVPPGGALAQRAQRGHSAHIPGSFGGFLLLLAIFLPI